MACTVTITTGNNEKVEVEVPSLPNSLQELKQYFSSNQYEELKSKIKTVIGQGKLIKSQVLSEIKKTNKIIPNTNIGSLKTRFPKNNFPEGFDDVRVLLINSYTTIDQELQFGIGEDSEGNKVFVIDNNFNHLENLSNYLALQRSIQEDDILSKLDKDSKDLLERCRESSGIRTVQEMVIQYLNNKDIFRNFRTSKNESVYERLNTLLSNLGYMSRRQEFKDSTANEFFVRLTINPYSDYATIPLEEFYNQVLKFNEKISKVIPDTFTKFKKFLKEESSTSEFDSLFPEGENKLERIINYIINKEPWINYSYESNYKDIIKLKKQFPSIKRIYNIGFNEITSMSYENYRGHYIFEYKKDGIIKYFPSFEYLSETSNVSSFDSKEEAKAFIDQKISKENASDYYDFRQLYLYGNGRRTIQKYLPAGSLIRIRNYPVEFGRIIPKIEQELILSGTMEDFETYIGTICPEALDYIDNIMDSIIFIYELNNKFGDIRTSEQEMLNVAKQISESGYRNFYIESTYKDKQDKRYQNVIETKDNELKEFKTNNNYPVVELFNAVKTTFGDKFGLSIEVLNNDEIKKQYKVEDAKAFIVGNKIVLNSTLASSGDIFHEYSHLVLGYLKKINYDSYIKLMEQVWNYLPSYTKNRVLDKYKNLPTVSKYEEGFVIAFGDYISHNKINNNLEELFKEQSNFIKNGISSIFEGETNIYKIFGDNIQSVFKRFNQEIGHLLNSGDDFLSFIKSDDFFLQRKKINWLEKQISEGKVQEKC